MERPDQKKFEMFIAPLVKYDAIWQNYSLRYGYDLELNPLRKPGRLLRSHLTDTIFNMTYMIGLDLEPVWFEIEYTDSLPYTFAVCAYCDKQGESEFRWRLAKKIIENSPFENIGIHLPDLLSQAFALITDWTPDIVMKNGELWVRTEFGGWMQEGSG